MARLSPYLRPKQEITPSIYYQRHLWRLSYNPCEKKFAEFKDYIYAFTWEDPREDMRILDINEDDNLLVITSGGDNALAYATEKCPRRIHCVDLNPHQVRFLRNILNLEPFT